jgi:tetratricopeptide (TPR) repeat protein
MADSRRPYSRSEYNRALILNALTQPFNVLLLAAVLIAGLLLDAFLPLLVVGLVVPGPGVHNASAALGTAYSCSSPVLLVAGQIESYMLGQDKGALHEINDQLDIVRPVTKWCQRVLNVAEIPGAIHEAMRQMQTGRPRPTLVEVPPDVLATVADVTLPTPERYAALSPDQVDIQRMAAEAWIADAEGRHDEALALMRAAAEREDETEKHVITPGPLAPAREQLAEMLLAADRPDEALQEFEAVQRVEPNRFRALYGAGRAAELAGDEAAAKRYYGRVVELAAAADTARPEIEAAKAFLTRN